MLLHSLVETLILTLEPSPPTGPRIITLVLNILSSPLFDKPMLPKLLDLLVKAVEGGGEVLRTFMSKGVLSELLKLRRGEEGGKMEEEGKREEEGRGRKEEGADEVGRRREEGGREERGLGMEEGGRREEGAGKKEEGVKVEERVTEKLRDLIELALFEDVKLRFAHMELEVKSFFKEKGVEVKFQEFFDRFKEYLSNNGGQKKWSEDFLNIMNKLCEKKRIGKPSEKKKNKRKITEIRGQVTENMGQVTENQGQLTENQGQITENQGQITENQGQITEIRGQITENQGQTGENRAQNGDNQGGANAAVKEKDNEDASNFVISLRDPNSLHILQCFEGTVVNKSFGIVQMFQPLLTGYNYSFNSNETVLLSFNKVMTNHFFFLPLLSSLFLHFSSLPPSLPPSLLSSSSILPPPSFLSPPSFLPPPYSLLLPSPSYFPSFSTLLTSPSFLLPPNYLRLYYILFLSSFSPHSFFLYIF